MSPEGTKTATDTARQYYDSGDADTFYATIWGGEDIHVGLYDGPTEPIARASRRTVDHLASLLSLSSASRVLDIGAGYGGAARVLVKAHGCQVTCLNLSRVENKRNRDLSRAAGLQGRITVTDGSFEDIPAADASFDAVWSQDAILHSGDRQKVLAEVARVLVPGGDFVFTDPMRADDCPKDVLEPILQRIHLADLGSPGFYEQVGTSVGLELVAYEDMTPQLARHYARVLEETTGRTGELVAAGVSEEYIERMKKGLGHWIEGGKAGYLAWGVFHFRKPA